MKTALVVFGSVAVLAPLSASRAGGPTELLRGEAPLLFTSSEGANVGSETVLLDGQLAMGDDIWLWVPTLDGAGMVDLAATGQFFQIWDSGNAVSNPGDFNDDNDNGLRGMDFDAGSETFLLSYEDTTTTGFAFGPILDGDLMRLAVGTTDDGLITSFTLTRVFSECTNGTPGCIGTGDLNAICLATDGTLFYGAGGAQTIQTDVPGTLTVGASTLVHADISRPSPINIGPDPFFEPSASGCSLLFCPAIYTGALRGADVLVTGEPLFGTSGDFRNTTWCFDGDLCPDPFVMCDPDAVECGAEVIGLKADILGVPDFTNPGATPREQRTADVVYSGSLFFQTPNVDNAELLDHDILDSADEINALIAVLGPGSGPGIALSAHVEASECPWDLNADRAVGPPDLAALLDNWGPNRGHAADFNGDGVVGPSDLAKLLDNWGGCPEENQ